MILQLYSGTRADPLAYSLGVLEMVRNDEVHEVLNGKFELTLQYPISGRLIHQIRKGRCIMARPNPLENSQPFVIYRLTKALNGWITVYAQHIAYQLRKTACTPFSAGSAAEAVAALKDKSVTETIFDFSTDLEAEGELNVSVPTAAWTLMGGDAGRILDTYGGEWEFDRFHVRLLAQRGADRGARVEYGLNMTDYIADSQGQEEIDGIYAFYLDEEGQIAGTALVLKEGIADASGALIEPRDYTDRVWDTGNPDYLLNPIEHLKALAAEELTELDAAGSGAEDSIKISFVRLSQSPEYKNTKLTSDCGMGDIVQVWHGPLKESFYKRVTEIRYQPSTGRYKGITLGAVPKSVVQTILKNKEAI